MSYPQHLRMKSQERISELLLAFGIHKGFPGRRNVLAIKVTQSPQVDRLTKPVMVKLLIEAQKLGANRPEAMVAGWLEDGSWTEILLDGEPLPEVPEKNAGRLERSNIGGLLKHAASDNPYGWSNPDSLREFDHNRPGEWNPYRQCFNKDHMHAPNGDYRSRRCSIFEIVGVSANQADRKERIKEWESKDWDPLEVQAALGFSHGIDPGSGYAHE